MQCPSCGYQNLPGADVCERCQTSLTQEDVPQAGTDVERSLMEDPIASLQPNPPVTVDRRTSLGDAIDKMRAESIGCVLVTEEAGRLIGILTERDLLRRVAGEGLDLDRSLVGGFMSQAPESQKPEHPLGYALHRMIISDLRYLAIVDERDRPVGILSSRDIIAYMATRLRPEREA